MTPQCDVLLLYQLVWLMLVLIMVGLNSALDYVLVAVTCACLEMGYLAVSLAEAAAIDALDGVDGEDRCRPRRMAQALVIGAVAATFVAYGARRINHFERAAFAQVVALGAELEEKRREAAGECVEVLAVLCNPTFTSAEERTLGLRSLNVGLEMKLLMRAVPRAHLEIVPAATFADAELSLARARPRVVLFSGHTVCAPLGFTAIAFEGANTRVDVDHAAPDTFVKTTACKL